MHGVQCGVEMIPWIVGVRNRGGIVEVNWGIHAIVMMVGCLMICWTAHGVVVGICDG